MNEIQQGICLLYEHSFEHMKKFHKKTYEDTFKIEYDAVRALLQKIDVEYEHSTDKDAAFQMMTEALFAKLKEVFAEIPNKRKREQVAIDYNMTFVTYFLPILNYHSSIACKKLAEYIVETWNRDFASQKIGNATYEEVYSGFKTRLCYITTAVCNSLGKGDACYELELLRGYRDSYLLSQEEGADIVNEYYDIAPTIVNRINKREDADMIYRQVWEKYLSRCISMIENDNREACKELYTEMVRELQGKYLYS